VYFCNFGKLHKGGLNILDGLSFVQKIEQELSKRKIPKERFYRESGISSATMSQWRKRVYSPSSAAIKKIEDYFNITFSLEQKNNSPSELELTEGEKDLLELFRLIPEEQQPVVLAMIRAALTGK
jgi:transcriptional regulator with XRE-family HTH domain